MRGRAGSSRGIGGQFQGAGHSRRRPKWRWGDAANAIKAWSEQIATILHAYTSGAKTPKLIRR
jgi:hypothetical protein